MNCRVCDAEIDPESCGWLSPEDADKLRKRIVILMRGLQTMVDHPFMKSPPFMFAKTVLENADKEC